MQVENSPTFYWRGALRQNKPLRKTPQLEGAISRDIEQIYIRQSTRPKLIADPPFTPEQCEQDRKDEMIELSYIAIMRKLR